VKLRASANVGNGGEQSSDPLVSINAGGGSFTGQSGSTELDGELVTLDVEDWATKVRMLPSAKSCGHQRFITSNL